MPRPVLELRNATVRKGRSVALDDVSLVVEAGQHTAILGPNGSGKSTLMGLLTAREHALHRDDPVPPVRVLGRDRWNAFELRAQIGVVSAALHHEMVAGSVLGPVTGHDAVVSAFFGAQAVFSHHAVAPEMDERADEALARADGRHLARRRLDQMSTGEARRVLLARALASRPSALALDEPTAGLDPVARGRFLHALRGIAGDGTTLILVTHHVEEIVPEMGRVVLLREGRVAFDGPKAEALTSARLSEAFGGALEVREAGGLYSARLPS